MRLKTEEHPSAKLGKEVHESIEQYLNGEIPAAQLHTLAKRVHAAGLIPTPGTVRVEHPIPKGAIVAAGVPCEGFIDVLDLNAAAPLVTDWKTRGDPVRYSKTDEQLFTDVQMNVYAAETFRMAPTQAVGVRHVNIGTKPPNAVTVSGPVRLTRQDVDAFFAERIEPVVTRMKREALQPSPFRVTPNFRACGAFGGCPFKDKCHADATLPSTTPGATAMSTTTKEALMSRLRNTDATPAATPTPGVRPPDAPASGAKAALLARLAGGKAPSPAEVPADAPQAPVAPAAGGPERKPRGHEEKLAALGYNAEQVGRMKPGAMREAIEGKIAAATVSVSKSGDLVVIPPKTAAPSVAAGPDLGDLDSCVKYAIEVLGFADADIDAMTDEMLLFVAEKQIKRASVDLVMGTDGKIADLEEKPAPAPAPVRTVTPEPGPIVAVLDVGTFDGLFLYIGCRPVKGAHAHAARLLTDYLAPLGALVAKDAKVEHYALIEYNEGPKRIAALVLRDPPKGVFVVDPGAPCSPAALEVLIPFADAVITAGA